jgi:uncharacterized protein YbaA (DUF1428 family)
LPQWKQGWFGRTSSAGVPLEKRRRLASPHLSTHHAKEHYVDGFVTPVPIRNLDAYRRIAEQAGKIWLEHGALQFWECVGDDVKPGKVTSFPQSVQLKDDETVVFSWILYNSREHRDSVNAKVMEDPRMKDMMDPKSMPFDGMRMFWGGFKSLVEL